MHVRGVRMPLIKCPNCSHITYAYPVEDEDGEIRGYRCARCYSFYNYDQVNTITFPNGEIVLSTTFHDIISEFLGIEKEKLLDFPSKFIAEKFVKELLKDIEIFGYCFVQWDFRGTKEADEYNDEKFEEVQRILAEAVDKGYYIIELREMDEGDSIFVAVRTEEIEDIINALNKYILVKSI